ncbi:DEAD-box ATP-dependent RNA helicase 3B, chloroplastic isoform X1 [Cryptomeria japonica]|uniref:DEAD-box ATP-dependent RNA helicase 3B, chloroplastic isoform X1 n=1 Tax=Cryptomeria japonica TaxID=3369 RepID=UPI0025ABA27C|nr:DEAD-box ATP-dependent RNA helicase 3B, chloroplastic isoform X1 [Cryptomeria japonica]
MAFYGLGSHKAVPLFVFLLLSFSVQGWTTLQMTKESSMLNGGRMMSARTVMGILSEIWPPSAGQVGKIKSISDRDVEGTVFDLPDDVAKELLLKKIQPGYTISAITEVMFSRAGRSCWIIGCSIEHWIA